MARMKDASLSVGIKRGKGNTDKPCGILTLDKDGRTLPYGIIECSHAAVYGMLYHPLYI